MKHKILLIEDEPELLNILSETFSESFTPVCLSRHQDLNADYLTGSQGALLDWSANPASVKSSLGLIRKNMGDEFPVAIYTGNLTLTPAEVYSLGASALFYKPVNLAVINTFFSNAIFAAHQVRARKCPRLRIQGEVSFNLDSDSPNRGVILNWSKTGLFISTQASVPNLGSLISLEIQNTTGSPNNYRGICRWNSSSKPYLPRGFGVEIVEGGPLDLTQI